MKVLFTIKAYTLSSSATLFDLSDFETYTAVPFNARQ